MKRHTSIDQGDPRDDWNIADRGVHPDDAERLDRIKRADFDELLNSAAEPKPGDMVVLHWCIGGASGHGEPVTYALACVWIEEMNKKHGAGTHWAEPASEGAKR